MKALPLTEDLLFLTFHKDSCLLLLRQMNSNNLGSEMKSKIGLADML